MSVDAVVKASRHEPVNGVALVARNSHQINQHLPRPGRATHGEREWYLAKECVGSDRRQKRTIATSRRDDDQAESNSKYKPHHQQRSRETGDYANHYLYAATQRETASA